MTEGEARSLSGRLARLGSVYVVARAVQVAALFVVLPAVTRLLDESQFGVVVLAQVVHQAVAAIVPLGLTSVVAWSIYERRRTALDDARRMVLATTVIAATLTTATALSAPWWTTVFVDVGNPPAMQIAIWMAIPVTVQAACLSVLQAQGRARAFAISSVISSAGGQILGLLLLLEFRNPTSYMAGVAAGFVVGAVVAGACVPIRLVRLPGSQALMGALRHGGPTVVHLLGFMLLAVGDRIIIERVMGVDAAARYQAAYSIGALAFAVLFALNNAWAPAVYDVPDGDDWSVLTSTTRWVYGFSTMLMAVLALAAPVLLRIAVPPSYLPADLVPVAVVVLASLLPNVTYLAAVHVVFRRRRTASLFLIVPLAGVVNIGLNLVLVRMWGLMGAAVSTLVGYLVGGLAAMAAARAVERIDWDRKFELLCYGLGAGVTVVSAVFVDNGIALVLRCVAAAAVGAIGMAAAVRIWRGGARPLGQSGDC